MKATDANDIVIIDEVESCPYLEGMTARMPLRMPLENISPAQVDLRLAEGNRRTGQFIYKTNCPNCCACEPIRLNVSEFKFSRNQRRTLSKINRKYTQRFGVLESDRQRVELFNKHRSLRGLDKKETDINTEDYIWGFVRSCFDSFEISYWDNERLVCLAVCDRGATSLSAVYTFFDPDLASDSLGTYSILKQIEFCQQNDLKHLYLGYYVSGSKHMKYKSRFKPHERLINGAWVAIENPEY